jgi:cyclophilin family peptidyl-prolyl cis-trans isomerase
MKSLILITAFKLELILFPVIMTAQTIPDSSLLRLQAPDTFRAVFITTQGQFTIEAYRSWSPAGADRLFQLITSGFYNDNCLFRVQPEYVVQFGISGDSAVNAFWEKHPIPDEPVLGHNLKGVISYARDGKETRTVQLFINKKDNFKLDTVEYNGLRGFTPVARILEGFEVVEKFNGRYLLEPANHQDSAMVHGNRYWDEKFPGMDYILEARLIED